MQNNLLTVNVFYGDHTITIPITLLFPKCRPLLLNLSMSYGFYYMLAPNKVVFLWVCFSMAAKCPTFLLQYCKKMKTDTIINFLKWDMLQ